MTKKKLMVGLLAFGISYIIIVHLCAAIECVKCFKFSLKSIRNSNKISKVH